MLIGYSPDEEAAFTIDFFVKKFPDPKTRPTFYTPFYSAREYDRVRAKVNAEIVKHDAETDADKRTVLLVGMMRMMVTRWENCPPEMNWDNITDYMTSQSLNAITNKMLIACRLSEIERGKSGPASIGGEIAPAATPQAAA